jgi:hypothetical protein
LVYPKIPGHRSGNNSSNDRKLQNRISLEAVYECSRNSAGIKKTELSILKIWNKIIDWNSFTKTVSINIKIKLADKNDCSNIIICSI